MFTRHENPILWKRVYPYLTHPHAPKAAAAVIAAALGAGLVATWPDASTGTSSTASVAPAVEQKQAAAEASCETQTWPYIDHRCEEAAGKAGRGTRQVRVVTDRGVTLTTVTAVPIVEPKQPAPPRRQAIAKADMQLGPAVAPAPPEQEQPLAQEAKALTARAQEFAPPRPENSTRVGPVAATSDPEPPAQAAVAIPAPPQPVQISTAAFPEPEVEGIEPVKKSKAAKAREKREAKRKAIESEGAVPAEVVAAVEAAARREPSRRTVPPEVIAAVEAVTGDTGQRSGYGVVRRVYIVPRGW